MVLWYPLVAKLKRTEHIATENYVLHLFAIA